jgi:hypothetical protein
MLWVGRLVRLTLPSTYTSSASSIRLVLGTRNVRVGLRRINQDVPIGIGGRWQRPVYKREKTTQHKERKEIRTRLSIGIIDSNITKMITK